MGKLTERKTKIISKMNDPERSVKPLPDVELMNVSMTNKKVAK